MTTFLLIRHGETQWNADGRLQGWRDSPLTAAGRSQVEAVPGRLVGERIDALVSSDLGRARDSAIPIAGRLGLALACEPGLRERCYGILEGKTWAEIERAHPEAYLRLQARDQDFVVPGGETGNEFFDRVIATFDRLTAAHGDARVAVVTHGGVLAIVYRRAFQIPLGMPRTFSIGNAAYNRVRMDGRRWTVEAWADVGHLPAGVLDDI